MAARMTPLRTERPTHMRDTDISWLAGIIEGEGWIGKQGNTCVRIAVKMTDEDIVRRLHSVTQSGTVSGPHIGSSKGKPYWTWECSRKQEVARLLLAIAPVMGHRRKQRISEMLDSLGNGRLSYRWEPTYA